MELKLEANVLKKDPRDIFPIYSRSKYHSIAKRIRRALNAGQSPKPKSKPTDPTMLFCATG